MLKRNFLSYKAIKSYRQFAQKSISEAHLDITIDQWLILKTLRDNPRITQQRLAAMVFKDGASVTRIIKIMVAKGYLKRTSHSTDGRRFALSITEWGMTIMESLQAITQSNRRKALKGISKLEIEQMRRTLTKIIANSLLSGE